jgi:hypothetical protein
LVDQRKATTTPVQKRKERKDLCEAAELVADTVTSFCWLVATT